MSSKDSCPDSKLKQQTSAEKKGIKELDISEAGLYAYGAICALTLAELFSDPSDHAYNNLCMKMICQHLKMNEKNEPVMMYLSEGKSEQSQEPYIALLMEEPNLKGKTILVVQDLVLLAVRNGIVSGEYDSRQRVLIRRVSELLNVPFELIEFYEHSLVRLLNESQSEQTEAEQHETERRDKIRRIKRYAAIGLATIGGGTLLGLTGGLAAPFIGVGVGTILGSASAAALGSTAGIAIIGSLFGVAGAGLTGYKMKKRVGEIEEFEFEPLTLSGYGTVDQQLHIVIAITGWLNDDKVDNVVRPWQSLSVSREQYALRYETKYLIEMGQAFEYILSMAVSMATQEALKYTILSSLISAVAWPATLLSIASVIDNPWSVCCRRSSEAGKQLAYVLLTRQHGKRPVTLVGFSLGARVIYYCLREMAEIGGGKGIVQDAILLGAPVTNNKTEWEKCSTVVAGRFVNGYCSSDWLLRFLYRTLSMNSGVAGLFPINCKKVINVDLSSIVAGHSEYPEKLPELLNFVGLNTKTSQVLDTENGMKKSNSEIPCPEKHVSNLKLSKSDMCLPSKKCLTEEKNTMPSN
ncbi:transmembrane and coiled-coil domain-containing protein 4-like isoform X1 [Neodiprion virginianus]|uniref:transmembrane and coiled-coil domain-containing protein 4-like isoform X1 n=1 Tax=Neodiprion virginianus TaxID=2961670 RepID=UPI001EE702CD|nr:transmembrane and coiled-coil domain-containing protein 4-like isoform X1 [Neodiprion virginianus]